MSLTLAMSGWTNLLLGGVEIDLNMAQSSINFSHTLAFALVRSIFSVNQLLLYFDFTLADASFCFYAVVKVVCVAPCWSPSFLFVFSSLNTDL